MAKRYHLYSTYGLFPYQCLFNNKTTSIVFPTVLSIVNNLERIKVFWEMGIKVFWGM